MQTAVSMLSILVLASASVVACGGSQSEPSAPPSEESKLTPAAEGTPDTAERPQLTAEECEAAGGAVVGDIGDGAVHRPDYRCENGSAPTGSIRAPEGGPLGVEGAVCCPK